jgi:hypothetical protein
MIIVCAVLEAVLDVIWSRLAQEAGGAGMSAFGAAISLRH